MQRSRGWTHGGHPDAPGYVLVPAGYALAVAEVEEEGKVQRRVKRVDSLDPHAQKQPGERVLVCTRGPVLVPKTALENAFRGVNARWGHEATLFDANAALDQAMDRDPRTRQLYRHNGCWRIGEGEDRKEGRLLDLELGESAYLYGNTLLLGGDTCPEQYDVWRVDDPRDRDQTKLAYVRLRHGVLRTTLWWPSKHGRDVLVHHDEGDCGGGEFYSDALRRHWLREIAQRVEAEVRKDAGR